MKTTKMNSMMNKLAALALAGVALTMGGCASYLTNPATVSQVDRTGKGEMYAIVDMYGKVDAAEMCAKHEKAASDARCANLAEYDAVAVTPHTEKYLGRLTMIPVLVPKEAGVRGRDIIKVRMQDGVPAFYEGTFGHVTAGFQDKSRGCYYDRGISATGGVICPKFGWSYKDIKPN